MIGLVLTLALIGFLLYLLEKVPMDGTIKWAIKVVVIVCVVFWLINVFGLLAYDVPVPRLDR